MPIEVKKVDGKRERKVLLGMILNDHVLGIIAPQWKTDRFPSRVGNLVGSWCVDYYRKYSRAPKSDIQGIFDRWAEIHQEREMIELVESLLKGLSDEARRSSDQSDYLIDQAAELFEATQLKQLTEQITGFIESGRVKEATELATNYHKLGIGSTAIVNGLTDDAGMAAALSEVEPNLVEYPGALGNFFKGALTRDSFVAVLAAEKRGKSTVLLDLAWRAVEQGRNVVYFTVGDMSKRQVDSRRAVRLCERPRHAGYWYVPISIEPGSDKKDIPDVEMQRFEADDDLSIEEESYRREKWIKKVGPDRLKMGYFHTASVPDLDAHLDQLERDGFAADLCVIDYADNLSPITTKFDRRDQINENWRAMRTLSQKHYCLVATATQADANSYDAWILKRSNFSDDKRKYAHITGIFGFNQTSKEKEKGVSRLNWLMLRELDFSEDTFVWCAGCPAIANPFILSTF